MLRVGHPTSESSYKLHYPAETVLASLCPFRPFFLPFLSLPFPSFPFPFFSFHTLFFVLDFQRGALLGFFRLRLDTTSGFEISRNISRMFTIGMKGRLAFSPAILHRSKKTLFMDRGDLNPRHFGDSLGHLAMLEDGEYRLASEGESTIVLLPLCGLTYCDQGAQRTSLGMDKLLSLDAPR